MTRRGRHIPRVCRTCGAPMTSQQGSCWRCGAAWTNRDGREDEPGGQPGVVLLDVEDRAAMNAAEPSADEVALARRA